MKFLHTSDWHVGRTIRSRSRLDEHETVLSEIVEIAQREQVDAVLVTGDIFHERRPPLAAEELVARTLAKLAAENIVSVVIPGNHDDAARLRTLKPLGELLQVHLVTDASVEPTDLIVSVHARSGGERALVACLPYLHPHQVLTVAEGAGKSEQERLSTYQGMVAEYFRALESAITGTDENAVSVVLAHAHISGTEFGGGEWRSSVFPIPPGVLPARVHYVALGHMHQPQEVRGTTAQARYAGSILQMDFGERGQKKSVCIVEAHPGRPAQVTEVPLEHGRPLLRVEGTAHEILSKVQNFGGAWVEAVIGSDDRDSETVDRIRSLESIVAVRFEDTRKAQGTSGTQDNLGEKPPRDVFAEYYETKRGAAPAPQLVALFEQLYHEASTTLEDAS